MGDGSLLVPLTGTGNVGQSGGGWLHSAVLTCNGAAAGTLVLREGGSGGTIILTMACPANDTRQAFFSGGGYTGQLHATLTGANSVATVEI